MRDRQFIPQYGNRRQPKQSFRLWLTKPRKNLRGFFPHARALVNRLVHEEFSELGRISVMPLAHEPTGGAVACWIEHPVGDGKLDGFIGLHTYHERPFYLYVGDEELQGILRHELLHAEMRRTGRPAGDSDIPFILECCRRQIPINEDAAEDFDDIFGCGCFQLYRAFCQRRQKNYSVPGPRLATEKREIPARLARLFFQGLSKGDRNAQEKTPQP